MKQWAWLWALGWSVCACGGAVDTNLLADSGDQVDASQQTDAPTNDTGSQNDATVNDSPIVDDVVTVDVPVGPPDSHIQCGNTLKCSAQNEICCHHTASFSKQWECVADIAACNGVNDVPIGCSAHENCVSQGTSSYICCANYNNSGSCGVVTDVSCMATCDPQTNQLQVGCGTSDPCPVDTPNCKVSTCSLVGYYICTP